MDRHAFDGSEDGGKFQQHAVAGRLDDAAAEVGHDRLGSIAPLAHRLRGASFALALSRE